MTTTGSAAAFASGKTASSVNGMGQEVEDGKDAHGHRAVIDFGHCQNLTDRKYTNLLAAEYRIMKAASGYEGGSWDEDPAGVAIHGGEDVHLHLHGHR
jgi:hypothetical protein